MHITIDVRFHNDPELARKLDDLRTRINSMEIRFMTKLQDIQDEVTAEATTDAAFLAIVTNLQANQNDPAALDAILKGMKANAAPFVAAVLANTPAAPPGNPAPPPVTPAAG